MSEPLVFVPPIMCDARVFAPQMLGLSDSYPVMFSPISMGERMEEIASQLLSWAPPRFALAGMGMGGMVAMEVLRRAPERVMRVAFIATNSQSDTPEFASSREPLIIAARSGRFDDVIRQEMDPSFFAPEPGRVEVTALVTQMAHTLGPEAYVRGARAMQRRRDQQPVFRKIKQPALVMCGEHDVLNPARRHAFMAELIPYAQLEVISGAGMLPTLEQPDVVTGVLREWMQQPLVLR